MRLRSVLSTSATRGRESTSGKEEAEPCMRRGGAECSMRGLDVGEGGDPVGGVVRRVRRPLPLTLLTLHAEHPVRSSPAVQCPKLQHLTPRLVLTSHSALTSQVDAADPPCTIGNARPPTLCAASGPTSPLAAAGYSQGPTDAMNCCGCWFKMASQSTWQVQV